MFRVSVLIAAVAFATSAIASTPAARQAPISAEAVQRWMFDYRHKPDPMRVPVAVKAMARLGAFKDAESSGVYVGFLAGVIGGNPAWAEDLIARMFPLPPESHWAVIRAIAYSGLPEWKRLLRNFAWRMPERRAMIDKYISGELPALDRIAFEKSPAMSARLRSYVDVKSYFGKQPRAEEPPPELIDTLWGYYFATGTDEPLVRLIAMLPLAKDEDSIEKVTLGSMAKYTLASNIARDPKLFAQVKRIAPKQPEETQAPLKEVIEFGRNHGHRAYQEGCHGRARGFEAKRTGLQAQALDLGADRPGRHRARLHWCCRRGCGCARPALRRRRRDVVRRALLPGRAAVGCPLPLSLFVMAGLVSAIPIH